MGRARRVGTSARRTLAQAAPADRRNATSKMDHPWPRMPHARYATWALVVVVSGCLAPGGNPERTWTTGTLQFHHVGVSDTVEPSIGVTADGHVFVVAGEDTLRSKDDGATWSLVHSLTKTNTGGVTDQPTTFDPWLWVDPATDRIFVNHMWPVLTCTLLSTSADGGDSWSADLPACPSPVVDFQKLVTGPPGPLPNDLVGMFSDRVAYLCFNKPIVDLTGTVPAGRYGLSCAASYDDGRTWTNEAHLSQYLFVAGAAVGDCAGGSWNPAVAPDGTVVVRSQPNCLFRSRDSGATWQGLGTGPTEFFGTRLGFDDAGTLYALSAYFEEAPLRIAHSMDQGDTWAPAATVHLPVKHFAFEAMATGPAGEVALAFYGTNDDPMNATARWTAWVGRIVGADTGHPVADVVQVPGILHVGCLYRWEDCRFLGDFMGATYGPNQEIWAVFVDDCPSACEEDATAHRDDLGPLDALVARYDPVRR